MRRFGVMVATLLALSAAGQTSADDDISKAFDAVFGRIRAGHQLEVITRPYGSGS